MAEKQIDKTIKGLTDNRLEFCAKYFEVFLGHEGIKHERSNVYNPEMNGVVKRYNHTLLDGVRF